MTKELEKQAKNILNDKLGKEKAHKFLKAIRKYNKQTNKFKQDIEPLLNELNLAIKLDMGFLQKKDDIDVTSK